MTMGIIPILILAFIAGTFFGSFFYTLALRYSDGQMRENPKKALFSRSQCPSCRKKINPILLVPILGYILQKGKCRNCGIRIPFIYPAMEILYALMAVLFSWRLGVSLYSINLFILAGIAVCITIIDIKSLTIPDSLVITFVILSMYPILINYNIMDNVLGLLSLFAFFIVILLIFPGAFGGGDLKLGSAIGLLLGFEMSIVVLEVSLLSGAVIGIIYAFKTGKNLKTKIPFAPFLTLGLIISILYGRDILLVYYRILF
jgi:prepilin signal peptidase PulO-like enzyme (type II secretory pathway)